MSASGKLALGLALLLSAPCAIAAPSPTPMVVPEVLLQRTSMPEASGVLWIPALGRYLVVSDDTGDKEGGTDHAPWLLAMSRAGVLDGEPVPIRGIERLNDAEAICAGPGASVLLATSHSPTRKGRDKPERRRLLRLELVGRALQVAGALDLAAAISAAGLVPGRAVDIEAIAFRDRALYIGLKAPQTEAGAALILRADGIEEALRRGALPPAQLQRFAEVRLQVEGPSGAVLQGISDMAHLPDGSFVLLANSPKGLPPDGGGALWWLRPGEGPRLLRRFPGQKPEGLALTEDRRALLIVIDRDRQAPLWTMQPLPAAAPAGRAP